jgi:hypothetical protein
MDLARNADACMDLRKRLIILLLAGPALLAGPGAGDANEVDLGREGPFAHLRAFQAIATENGGNRAAGTPGFDRSADYVADRLNAAGYQVRLESFEFPYFEERSPPILLHDSGAHPRLFRPRRSEPSRTPAQGP